MVTTAVCINKLFARMLRAYKLDLSVGPEQVISHL
jgi:hypothetical protein